MNKKALNSNHYKMKKHIFLKNSLESDKVDFKYGL